MSTVMTRKSLAAAVGLALLGAIAASPGVNGEGKSGQDDVIAIGPVEVIEAGQVTVLGRVYKTDDLGDATTGEKVAVHGVLLPDGSAKNVYLEHLGNYVAGSDQIFEAGVVTKASDALGTLSIGDSEVDYTATLASGASSAPAVGEMVAVLGTQPAPGGVILGNMMTSGVAAVVTFTGVHVAALRGGNASTMATGGSNSMATGGSNSMATGGSNSMATGGSNSMATGGSNSMATGGSNSMATGGSNSMATGGSNSR
jgi:hypothetical protein